MQKKNQNEKYKGIAIEYEKDEGAYAPQFFQLKKKWIKKKKTHRTSKCEKQKQKKNKKKKSM